MRAGVAGLALLALAACQPGSGGPDATPAAVAPEPPVVGVRPPEPTIIFPEPTGPVANYFMAEMPFSIRGRWAEDEARCAGEEAVVIDAKSITSAGMSAAVREVEINDSASVIINMAARAKVTISGETTDGRILMRQSADGSHLQLTGPRLPYMVQRCL